MAMISGHAASVVEQYKGRAGGYDDTNGGWHRALGEDFAAWLDPSPGDYVLDLACGTGLVTLPLARRIRTGGRVVAVDITAEMVEQGKIKNETLKSSLDKDALAHIDWLVGDITSPDLLMFPEIQNVVKERGGFDGITLCSALVLLPDQKGAIDFWTKALLKPGGKILVDVPTERLTLQYIRTYHARRAAWLPTELSKGRTWVESSRSLENLFVSCGLVPEWTKTSERLGETPYCGDEETALRLLQVSIDAGHFEGENTGERMNQVRAVWKKCWKEALVTAPDGQKVFVDGHWLYVTKAKKV